MQKDVATAYETTPVTDLARTMTERHISHIPIVNRSRQVVGVVTAADMIAKHASPHLPKYFSLLGVSVPIESRKDDREIEKMLSTTASEIMSVEVVSITPEADVDLAATVMLDNRVSFLPVVKDGELLGVIDENDIVRLLVVEEES
jgi:CBS domain-containing protein